MTGIIRWGCYVPRNRIAVGAIAQAHGRDGEQVARSLLISEKSVAGIDEDTATIAVAAARNATSGINAEDIGAIYIGSESHPYAVKPTGTIVGEALRVGNQYTTADLEFACKAGTAALQISLGLVRAGMVRYALAGGCDTAQAAPGDPLEYTAAAGGAVFVVGKEKVAATINETVSFTSDTPDFWRRAEQKHPMHGGAFTGEPAYFTHVIRASELLMRKAGTKPEEYDHVIFHQPNGKFPARAAQRLGFTPKQLAAGLVVDRIGNTYAGASLLGLCAVLDVAKTGERILLTSYGSGAGSDSFDIEVTDAIEEARQHTRAVTSYIEDKRAVDYVTYLRYTRAL